jgi:hypothetical protein
VIFTAEEEWRNESHPEKNNRSAACAAADIGIRLQPSFSLIQYRILPCKKFLATAGAAPPYKRLTIPSRA